MYYKWSELEKSPYAFSSSNSGSFEWASFEDVRSFEAKLRYLLEMGLAGAMLFSLDMDDLYDYCGQGSLPLLTQINYHLNPSLLVKRPNPDRLFNLTLEKTILENEERLLRQNYSPNRDSNAS